MDSNKDNVYMVTVVVTDVGVDSKTKMTGRAGREVTVMNVDEDWDGHPVVGAAQWVGIELTATLTDPDGGRRQR